MSARLHFAALEAFVKAQGVAHVLDSEVATIPPGGYVVLYVSEPLRLAHRMPARHELYHFEVMARCVGADARQARWVAERVGRLTDHTLTVAGYVCRPVRPTYAGYPVRDDDLTSAVVEVVNGFAYDAELAQ